MTLDQALQNSILLFDGAYGTSFQALCLGEEAYRGDHPVLQKAPGALKGNHELLNLTKPQSVEAIHADYITAGSRIITANTFNANAISQADYQLSSLATELAGAGVRIALSAAAKAPHKVWVAGSLGPTNKTLSIGADVENPHLRSISYAEVYDAYAQQIAAMVDAGVEIILIETIFDTLNAKAAIAAYIDFFDNANKPRLPLWISATITDRSGRTLSGQTLEAFVASVLHARPSILGLNCAMGAADLLPYVRTLSQISPCALSVHPNAGLPNELGGYDQTATEMAAIMATMAQDGLVNIIGGCCGTQPEHIKAMADATASVSPRELPSNLPQRLSLAGLEPLIQERSTPQAKAPFLFIGERTNVTGSPRFAKAVRGGDMAAAVEIARQQVDAGANMIDICFDDALLEGAGLMRDFLNRIAAEPDISRVPLMIDSSQPSVLEAGLQSAQGKCVVNSLSLKEGEADFLAKAALVRKYGAAAVVMAFDEQGQASDVERRVAICKRAYQLLTSHGWTPDDIIFDLNILTVGTGIPEHANYAADFIKAIALVKESCPGCRISGGLSNLSFAFRGQNRIREALHAVFLYHAVSAGLDMAIVAAGMLTPYDAIDPDLRELSEDLIFNRTDSATEDLLAYAAAHASDAKTKTAATAEAWRELPLAQRLAHALMHGVASHVAPDAEEALSQYPTALEIIEGPLMDGMRQVGDLFGEGKMFLPQVVKSARVMKAFVAYLQPTLEAQKSATDHRKKVLLATVKGDVHDIGKNIVGVVLDCNGYEVIDLGVMVPTQKILEAIKEHQPDIVGLSGLITPSLHEMIANAQAFQKAGCTLPLLIGGATTSRLHTALKIDPAYEGAVIYVPDASRVVEVCSNLLGANADAYVAQTKAKYEVLRTDYASKDAPVLATLSHARAHAPELADAPALPQSLERQSFTFSPADLIPYIDFSPFFWAWGLKGIYPKIVEQNPEAAKLFADGQAMLATLAKRSDICVKGVMEFWPAQRSGDDVAITKPDGSSASFSFLRQQSSSKDRYACMADFVSSGEGDSIGGFVVSVPDALDAFAESFKSKGDDYNFILVKALGDRLVEAAAEYLHILARRNYGQSAEMPIADLIAERYDGIRPALGYPSLPDHTQKALLWELLSATALTGATLTENFAMAPASTVSGLYFHNPASRYFTIGKIAADQLEDYAARRNWSLDEARKWLAPNI